MISLCNKIKRIEIRLHNLFRSKQTINGKLMELFVDDNHVYLKRYFCITSKGIASLLGHNSDLG